MDRLARVEWWILRSGNVIDAFHAEIRAKRNAYAKPYMRNRRASDPGFRVLTAIRSRVGAALRGKGRSGRTMTLTGCTVAELKTHIEQQFVPGMTWANHGKWEIDHIKPCASFDLTSETEQRLCFHYSNLQPLWKAENRRKRDKINGVSARRLDNNGHIKSDCKALSIN